MDFKCLRRSQEIGHQERKDFIDTKRENPVLRKQNEAIFDALFPKAAQTILDQDKAKILQKFSHLPAENQQATNKMFCLMKSLGIDIKEFDKQLTVTKPKEGRASAGCDRDGNGKITVRTLEFTGNDTPNTVYHELEHHLEFIFGKKVHGFYRKNAKGSPFKIKTFAGEVYFDETMKNSGITAGR